MPRLNQLLQVLERMAPSELAESWDRVGLQVGRTETSIRRVMIALDLTSQVFKEGQFHQVDGFILHHPFFFKPLTAINPTDPHGQLLAQLIRNDQFVIAVHTNIDKADYGINHYLANILGLVDPQPLESADLGRLKAVVFSPASHLETVRQAMSDAGAGQIGDYSECSFSIEGSGTFRPGITAQPYIGQIGVLETVAEARLEMIIRQSQLNSLLQAIRRVHPYQEPVVEFYPVQNATRHGLGRIGDLPQKLPLQKVWELVKTQLRSQYLKVSGLPEKSISRIAICSGSGGSLLRAAMCQHADVYLTGELNYHDHWEAREAGLAVIEAGHATTEDCFISLVAEYLEHAFDGENLQLIRSGSTEEPYRII